MTTEKPFTPKHRTWRLHTSEGFEKPEDWHGYAWVGYVDEQSEPDGRFDGCVCRIDRRNDASQEWKDQADSDARLIAAAPTMYAMLEDILGFLQRSGYDTKMVKQVLDEARGKQAKAVKP
jgi:hypothetical protein